MDTREWPVSCFLSCLVSGSPGSSHANSWKRERCACVLGSMIFIWEHPEPRIPAAFVSSALRKKSHCAYKLNAAETSYCEKLHRGFYYINSVCDTAPPIVAQSLHLAMSYWARGWQRCPLCLCRCTSAWTPLRNQLENACQGHRYGSGCSSGPRPGARLSWVPWDISQAGRVLKHGGRPESCTSLEVLVPRAICPLRLGVTPVVYHLCEQLLSWKSSSCIPRRAAGGRVGAAPPGVEVAGSWVRPDQPHSWPKNVALLPELPGGLRAGSVLHGLCGSCVALSAVWRRSRWCSVLLLFSCPWGPSGEAVCCCQAWCMLRCLTVWAMRLCLGCQICSLTAVSSLGEARLDKLHEEELERVWRSSHGQVFVGIPPTVPSPVAVCQPAPLYPTSDSGKSLVLKTLTAINKLFLYCSLTSTIPVPWTFGSELTAASLVCLHGCLDFSAILLILPELKPSPTPWAWLCLALFTLT